MRILFDQGTPVPLRNQLPGHDIATAHEEGWSTLSNGDLLAQAEAGAFRAADYHRPTTALSAKLNRPSARHPCSAHHELADHP